MFDASFLKDFFIHFWLHPQMWSLKKTVDQMHYYNQFTLSKQRLEAGRCNPACESRPMLMSPLLQKYPCRQNNPCPALPCRQHLVGITLSTRRREESPCLLYKRGTDAHKRKNINLCRSDMMQLYRDLMLKLWFWIQRKLKGILSVIPHAPPSCYMSVATWLHEPPNQGPHLMPSRPLLFSLAVLADAKCLHEQEAVQKGFLGSFRQM